MRPQNLKTKIFLDSGDPKETKEALKLLGFLDGQTTNPSLISKNPDVLRQIAAGKKYSKPEIYEFYKIVAQEISALIAEGSVSIEVYADQTTSAEQMLEQGTQFFQWIPNAHIKYPVLKSGLEAAEQSIKDGLRVNMTLVFSQEQGAAVYAATKNAKKGDVFLSPFIGRLDDKGENGINLIKNTVEMYKNGDDHVEILVASIRTFDHFMAALQIGADIITAPLKIYKEWAAKNMVLPDEHYKYAPDLKPIAYKQIELEKNWRSYDLQNELTENGIEKFVADWNALIKND